MYTSPRKISPRGQLEAGRSYAVLVLWVFLTSLFGGCGKVVMNDNSTVRLIDSGKYVCDDPSIDILRRILESGRPSADSFFILGVTEQEYLQGKLTPTGFVLEYREGGPDAHYEVQGRLTLDETLEIVGAYIRRDNDWKESCQWKQVYW